MTTCSHCLGLYKTTRKEGKPTGIFCDCAGIAMGTLTRVVAIFALVCSAQAQLNPSDGRDCDDLNPCTEENIENGDTHFAYRYNIRFFVQCGSQPTQCFVMPCGPGTIWNQGKQLCVWPDDPDTETEIEDPPDPILYNCEDECPCTQANRELGRYMFAAQKGPDYFVHCGPTDMQCWEVQCPGGVNFNPAISRCHD